MSRALCPSPTITFIDPLTSAPKGADQGLVSGQLADPLGAGSRNQMIWVAVAAVEEISRIHCAVQVENWFPGWV
ncbi:hypothetical protein LAUMK41_05498 [Mycobacterium attenuatum]|nr:hypothetical protein LAUMK41_05498 [Mycobacterium attenuatum]